MLYRIGSASARPVRRAFTTIMATTMFVAASAALAQQPAQQQRPQAQPAQKAQPTPPAKQQQQQRPAQTPPGQQPQQPQQAQQGTAEPPQLIYSPWTKFCLKEQSGKQVCFTGKDARIESGMPVASAALIEPEGESKNSCGSTCRSP